MAERTTEQLERALAERDAELAELRRRLAVRRPLAATC
jgi:hypothetical protein